MIYKKANKKSAVIEDAAKELYVRFIQNKNSKFPIIAETVITRINIKYVNFLYTNIQHVVLFIQIYT